MSTSLKYRLSLHFKLAGSGGNFSAMNCCMFLLLLCKLVGEPSRKLAN